MASSVVLTPNLTGATGIELAQPVSSGIWLTAGDDSLVLPVPVYSEDYAESPDAEGAQRIRSSATSVHGQLAVTIRGTTASDFYTQQDNWQQVIEAIRRPGVGGTLVYTPDGGTAITYDIESAYITEMPQDSVRIGQKLCESRAELVFQPYGRLPTVAATLSVVDPFNNDTISSQKWRFDTGSGTIAVTSGQLVPSSTAEKFLYLNIKTTDATNYLKITSGASVATGAWEDGLVQKRLDSSNYLVAQVDGNTGPQLRLRKKDGGSFTNLATATLTALSTATNYWLSFAIVGNVCTVKLYSTDPNSSTTPTQVGSTLSYTLTGGDATKFGSGVKGNPGIRLVPKATDWRYDDWRHDSTGIESSDQIIDVAVYNTPGSVEGLGKATLTDLASQVRRHVEIGVDDLNFDPTSPPWTVLDSDVLVTTGLAGTGSTQSGAYDPGAAGNNTISATLIPTAQAICATPVLATCGDRKIKARLWSSGTGDIYARLAYRVGDGDWSRMAWVKLPVIGTFVEVTLGTPQIPKAIQGVQRWEARIEAYSQNPGDTFKVDLMKDLPARRFAKARAPRISQVSGSLVAYDTFLQTTGALTGKVSPFGGTWTVGAAGGSTAEDGDADDFQVDPLNDWITRSASTDSSLTNGRYVTLGTTIQANTEIQADILQFAQTPPAVLADEFRTGVFARFVNTDNWLLAVRRHSVAAPGVYVTAVSLFKRVAGTVTQLNSLQTPSQDLSWYTLKLTVDSAGNAAVYSVPGQNQSDLGSALFTVSEDTDLATGGALDDGKFGVYDACNYNPGSTRYIDNFSVTTSSVADLTQTVIQSGKSAALRHNAFTRQSTDGLGYVQYPSEGSYLKLMPAGRESRAAQIVAQARRNDIDTEADTNTTDALNLTLDITPRVALISR